MKWQQEAQGQLRLQSLGMTVKGSEAQLLLSSIHTVAGKECYNPADQYVVPSLVSSAEFRDFDHDLVYSTPELLATDGVHISQRRKRIFARKLAAYQNNLKQKWGKG